MGHAIPPLTRDAHRFCGRKGTQGLVSVIAVFQSQGSQGVGMNGTAPVADRNLQPRLFGYESPGEFLDLE